MTEGFLIESVAGMGRAPAKIGAGMRGRLFRISKQYKDSCLKFDRYDRSSLKKLLELGMRGLDSRIVLGMRISYVDERIPVEDLVEMRGVVARV